MIRARGYSLSPFWDRGGMADTLVLEASGLTALRVQVPPVPLNNENVWLANHGGGATLIKYGSLFIKILETNENLHRF